jgi:hypothetical protein
MNIRGINAAASMHACSATGVPLQRRELARRRAHDLHATNPRAQDLRVEGVRRRHHAVDADR